MKIRNKLFTSNIFLSFFQVRNPATNLCLDTLQKDEKITFNMGLFSCQNGASANEVY